MSANRERPSEPPRHQFPTLPNTWNRARIIEACSRWRSKRDGRHVSRIGCHASVPRATVCMSAALRNGSGRQGGGLQSTWVATTSLAVGVRCSLLLDSRHACIYAAASGADQ